MKPNDIDEDKLIQILRKEEQAAYNFQTSDLMETREDALDYYDRQPYGDEQEGSSSVVTSEFADVIESLMPGFMRVFATTRDACEFKPGKPGEERWAKEASEYVPHVLFFLNDGFRIIYWFIKDCLMYRLSAVTVDVEDYEDEQEFPIKGLPQDAINILVAEAEEQDAEIEMDLTPDEGGMPGIPFPEQNPMGQPGVAVVTFSGTITVTKKAKRVVADNVAPEDILFTPTARDQDKASFLGYRKKVTASDLINAGLSLDEVNDMRSDRDISPEENQRNDAAILNANSRNTIGDSERELWLVVAYVKVDVDGNGNSEELRVVYAHSGGTVGRIIEKMEWVEPASVSLMTPILMSHTIVGRSLFDQVKDLQQIGSVLTRGLLNNQYAVITPRPIVSDSVDLASVLDWTPGSPIRLKAGARPGDGHVNFLQVPDIGPSVLQAMEYFHTVREDRTGVVRNNQGLDADSLNKTATGMQMLMSAAQGRQELIARTMAETGIKRLYQLVYRAIKKAASGPTKYLSGEQFKDADPTKWPDDMALNVNVGAGTKDLALAQLMQVAAAQEKLIVMQGGQANGPYVTPDNVANAAEKLAETLGYKTPGLFFQPPEKVMQAVAKMAQNPPPPDPKLQIEMLKVQGETAKAQSDQTIAQVNAQAATAKAQGDAGHHQIEAQLKQQALALQADKQAKEHDRHLQEIAVKARANDQLHEREMQKMALGVREQHQDHAHEVGAQIFDAIATNHQSVTEHHSKMAIEKAKPKPRPNGGAA